IIDGAGYKPERLFCPPSDICENENSDLSRNICSYAHSLLKHITNNRSGINRVIITDSCDAMKKLFDILYLQGVPVFMLSVPRQKTPASIDFLAQQYKSLYTYLTASNTGKLNIDASGYTAIIKAYEIYSNIGRLLEELKAYYHHSGYSTFFSLKQSIYNKDLKEAKIFLENTLHALRTSQVPDKNDSGRIPVVISGSPMPGNTIFSIIEDAGFNILFNDSCLDGRWRFTPVSEKTPVNNDDIFLHLADLYLSKIPCARMYERKDELDKLAEMYPDKIKGIIQFRMPFCDLYGFDLIGLMAKIGKQAILQIETDGSVQSEGQIKTRIQAFAETLSTKIRKEDMTGLKTAGSYYCGLDIGSTTIDGVILSTGGDIISYRILKTSPGTEALTRGMFMEMLKEAGLRKADLGFIMATGYGRESIGFADGSVTEISCHARGVVHLLPGTRFVIDIGGQDSKVIKMDGNGKVEDFQMNDKCAAGTGRFLEVMAGALGLDMEEMSRLSRCKGSPVPISSVCTVFAESEVISLLGKGHTTSEIVKGIYHAITNRLEGMVRRVGLVQPASVTGGGALNQGLVAALEKRLNVGFSLPKIPQIVGAVGAALLGKEQKELQKTV
ncbi:MAG: acyl-CoA dehydratase activase, partial [Spirochaetota bacterium]